MIQLSAHEIAVLEVTADFQTTSAVRRLVGPCHRRAALATCVVLHLRGLLERHDAVTFTAWRRLPVAGAHLFRLRNQRGA